MPETSVQTEVKSERITTKDRAYRLQYRHLNRFSVGSGKVQEKVFWFKGNQKDAVARARKHCELMGYIYIYCYPFIVDLEAQESLKSQDIEGINEDEY